MSTNGASKSLLIYVHVPFCRSKCHFCDWVQAVPRRDLLLGPEDERRRAYVSAICREIIERGPALIEAGYRPDVLYFGGGTASSLSLTETNFLFEALHNAFGLHALAEATMECSPDTLTRNKLEYYKGLGIDRISIGLQSLDDGRLRRLGRIHDSRGGIEAVNQAADCGFDRINVDIMCGFPDESLTEVAETVSAALKLPSTHLSIYAFRPTPGTVLSRGLDRKNLARARQQQLLAMSLARAMAASAGLVEYAFGYFGEPALNIVRPFRLKTDVVGFGSGAVSILQRGYYGHSKGHLGSYLADPLRWDFSMPAAAAPVALSLLRSGLSVLAGLDHADWEQATGVSLLQTLAEPALAPVVNYLRTVGRLVEDERGIRLPADRISSLLGLAFDVASTLPDQTDAPISIKPDAVG